MVDSATWQAELDARTVPSKARTRQGDASAAADRPLPMAFFNGQVREQAEQPSAAGG